MYSYINGNVNVSILKDGTKIRECSDVPKPIFPESIDLKITNYCDLFKLCQFCHEASNIHGEHASLNKYHFLLEQLPDGAELAIGGGNPLAHPELQSFLEYAKKNHVICNLTVNEQHLKMYKTLLSKFIENDLVKGLGISYTGKRKEDVKYFCNLTDNVVFHLIMGVHEINLLDSISQLNNKVLILGYKHFRKGNTFYDKNQEEIDKRIYKWYIHLPKYFKSIIMSFDNLAISQLKLKRWFTDKSWNEFYMGDDGTFTMYIDAVNNKYSKSSTSNKKYDINGSIAKMFKHIRENENN